jgi:hypothetical protein
MGTKNRAWLVAAAGTFNVIVALVEFVNLQIGLINGHHLDMTAAAAVIAVVAIGIATSTIAYVLKRIEARLTMIESAQADERAKSS